MIIQTRLGTVNVSTAEMIETVYECRADGKCGSIRPRHPRGLRGVTIVTADNLGFDVWEENDGFAVQNRATGIVGMGSTVLEAANLAVNP